MTKILATLCVVGLVPLPIRAAERHYLARYAPVAIWTLDQEPASENLSDTSGRLKAKVHGNKKKGFVLRL